VARSSGPGPVDTLAGDIALFSWDEHPALIGVSNGPIQFKSARKIWPLLELLAKIR